MRLISHSRRVRAAVAVAIFATSLVPRASLSLINLPRPDRRRSPTHQLTKFQLDFCPPHSPFDERLWVTRLWEDNNKRVSSSKSGLIINTSGMKTGEQTSKRCMQNARLTDIDFARVRGGVAITLAAA